MNKTTRWILFVILLSRTWSAIADDGNSKQQHQRRLCYSITMENTTDRMIPVADLWVCAPLKQAATQHGMSVDASRPYDLIEDRQGNQILHFAVSNMAPYAMVVVRLDATVDIHSAPRTTMIDPAMYLAAEPNVEFDDAEFKRLAPTFAATNPTQRAFEIFRWITANIKDSGYLATDHGALYALRNRSGDCTEFADLFVALCRQNNIPARRMGGYELKRNSNLNAGQYHNWAEFHVNDAWQIADPQKNLFMTNTSQYVATRMMGASSSGLGSAARFRSSGNGVVAAMRSHD